MISKINSIIFLSLFIILFFALQSITVYATEAEQSEGGEQCLESLEKQQLSNGWYLWEPYQFNKITAGGYSLTGMDIELVKSLAGKVGIEIEYEQIEWGQHQQDLREGKRDIAAGSTYTKERAEYVYFSVPYRFEENSLFVLHDSDKSL